MNFYSGGRLLHILIPCSKIVLFEISTKGTYYERNVITSIIGMIVINPKEFIFKHLCKSIV